MPAVRGYMFLAGQESQAWFYFWRRDSRHLFVHNSWYCQIQIRLSCSLVKSFTAQSEQLQFEDRFRLLSNIVIPWVLGGFNKLKLYNLKTLAYFSLLTTVFFLLLHLLLNSTFYRRYAIIILILFYDALVTCYKFLNF